MRIWASRESDVTVARKHHGR